MLREFTDKAGINWFVWDVYPTTRGAAESPTADGAAQALPHRELNDGWLCFESSSEKRRVAPIPTGWETCEHAALAAICSRAGYVSQAAGGGKRRDAGGRDSNA